MKKHRHLILLIINILFTLLLAAQDEPKKKYARTISVSQFIKELQNPNVDSVNLNNIYVVADPSVDRRFQLGATNVYRKRNWDSILQAYPPIIVDKAIYLDDIRFGQRTILPKIIFID